MLAYVEKVWLLHICYECGEKIEIESSCYEWLVPLSYRKGRNPCWSRAAYLHLECVALNKEGSGESDFAGCGKGGEVRRRTLSEEALRHEQISS